jgi:hypothetical protein
VDFNRRAGVAPVILAVLVIVIIVAGVGVYYVATSGSSSSPSSSTAGTTSSTTHPVTSTTATATTSEASTVTTSTVHSTTSSTAVASTTSTAPVTTATTSSQGTTVTQSTFSCTATYTSTTGTAPDYTPQYISLVQHYSSIQFEISDLVNGTQQSETLGYTRATVSPGIFNVSLTFSSSSSGNVSESASFVVNANNNTVLSATLSGYTFPKAQAKSFFDSFMGIFGLQVTYSNELGVFTDSAYFKNTGTSSKTFGQVTFDVTTYVANNTPETVDSCGVSATINSYTLEVGTPPGSSLPFITYLQFEGTSNGTSENVTFQLVSLTVG